ncbi:hypothetical protein HL658_06435 [Azospirillum sp. RWY-5-1]|uniref:Uncharacterized protein n=1 Tax=Azospirillum oleiclasticum TaxID=2735135 RepID=A0ABX2T9H9_9PROT|nr:hypothetical protein [Azospirillum oleiclasticum]NYZ12180.1 hypothetical protein [Azospirillum oleiclasticum]NYZ19340.1 hypothetical protein [Azospirillum oleiclasticum]
MHSALHFNWPVGAGLCDLHSRTVDNSGVLLMLSDRVIRVDVRDLDDLPVGGAKVLFSLDGEPFSEVVTGIEPITCQISSQACKVGISVSYKDYTEGVLLSQDANRHVFSIPIHQRDNNMTQTAERWAVIVGCIFVAIAIFLGFYFDNQSSLQNRIIISVLSIGLASFGSTIIGVLKVEMKLGQRLAVTAAGALAIFVLLFFFGPGE